MTGCRGSIKKQIGAEHILQAGAAKNDVAPQPCNYLCIYISIYHYLCLGYRGGQQVLEVVGGAGRVRRPRLHYRLR